MKIAICLSGQLRAYEQCFPSQDANLFQPLQPDIFLHTWDRIGVTHKTGQLADPDASQAAAKTLVSDKRLQALYHPTALAIEAFDGAGFREIEGVRVPGILIEKEPVRYKGALPMTYGMKQCLRMLRQEEERSGSAYDIVFRLRPDIKVLERVPTPLLDRPEHLHWSTWPELELGTQVSDKFAFSSSENMGYYLSIFDYLDAYWKDPLGDGQFRNVMVGERLMRRHIDAAPFPSVPINLTLDLVR